MNISNNWPKTEPNGAAGKQEETHSGDSGSHQEVFPGNPSQKKAHHHTDRSHFKFTTTNLNGPLNIPSNHIKLP